MRVNKTKGFTLVELLVVIAVIAMTMGLLFPNFMGVRQRARDTQRKSDVRQLQKAIELYKLDQYPPAYPTAISSCGICWSSGANCTGNLYIKKIPCDPGSINPTPYIYPTFGVGQDPLTYGLTACLENAADPDKDTATVAGCGVASYTVNEP